MLPYWLDDDLPSLKLRPLSGDPDVVVVGAGITGCSAALHLARRGLRVRLQDSREVAAGASGRNGGFALRGLSASFDTYCESIGGQAASEVMRLTEQALEEMAGFAGDAFRRVGSLRVAMDEEERNELQRELEALRSAGHAVEWRDALPGPLAGRATAALFHPTDGALQPARLVRRLATLAADAGAEIVENRRLVSREEAGGAQIVVCTDGYPSGLLGPLEGLIVPTRGQVIATEPLAGRWFETPHYGRHGFDYWHQTPDGRLVAGGFRDTSLESEFTDEEVTTPHIVSALEAFAAELAGRPVRVDYRWAGIFGLVLDFLPVVGAVPELERTWVAAGYSGHGNVLGYLCGRLVADAIIGDPHPVLGLFDPARLIAH
ncbi:MAG: NAD(P)/FAD-dependent oxidoreductase [Gaiella sp.]